MIKKIMRTFYFIAILLLTISNISLGNESEFSLSVRIAEKDDLPDAFLPSVFAGYANRDALSYLVTEFDRLGFVRLEIESIITASKNMKDYKQRLKSMDPLIKAISSKGGKIILLSSKVPLWLSSNRSKKDTCNGWRVYEASPPRNYKKYATMVYHTVNHFNNELKLDIYYEVWSEPELVMQSMKCDWLGSQDEMIELIKYFVVGAKKADRKAKVVFPAVSNPLASIEDMNNQLPKNALIYQLIERFAKTPLPELNLKRVPIDFISFHSFDTSPSEFPKIVSQVKQWLANHGYHSTGIIVSEWNGHMGNLLKNAAYYLSMIKSISTTRVAGHAFASLQDFHNFEPGKRDFGMVAKEYAIKKPVFHAMKLLTALKGKQVDILTDSPTIDSVASYDRGTLCLLAWNYVLKRDIKRKLLHKNAALFGYTQQRMESLSQILREAGVSKKELAAFIQSGKAIKKSLPQETRNELIRLRRIVLDAEKAAENFEKTRQDISLNLEKVPGTILRYQRYVIDSTHSNAFYYFNKAIKLGQSRTDALEEAKEHHSIQKVEDRIIKKTDKIIVGFEPDSIHLFVLRNP